MERGSGSGLLKQSNRSKPRSSVEFLGGRLRFTLELKPDETTIVSWKNLMKEANLNKCNPNSSLNPFAEAPHSSDSHPPPPPPPSIEPSDVQTIEYKTKDFQAQASSNRLSAVIERIERMYSGNSDDDDLALGNVPDDDDEYDTEDSFIDDSELDDYFKVDDSAIKHDGFFIHRGKLERIEPIISIDQQPKKREHTYLTEGSGSEDGHKPHKIAKKESKGEAASSVQRSSTSLPDKDSMLNVQIKSGNPMPIFESNTQSTEESRVGEEQISFYTGAS